MRTKLGTKTLALTMCLVFGLVQAAFSTPPTTLVSRPIPASGSLAAQTTFNMTIVNASDAQTDGLKFTGSAGATMVKGTNTGGQPAFVKLQFSDNSAGFTVATVSTKNRASPNAATKFSPGNKLATGAGIVGALEKAPKDEDSDGIKKGDLITAAPLVWAVFTALPDAVGYTWPTRTNPTTGKLEPDTRWMAYVVDKDQNMAEKMNPRPIPWWDDLNPGDPKKCALCYASVIYGISDKDATLSNAGVYVPDPDDPPASRKTTEGLVYIAVAVAYMGQAAQPYQSDTLTLELLTY